MKTTTALHGCQGRHGLLRQALKGGDVFVHLSPWSHEPREGDCLLTPPKVAISKLLEGAGR